MRILGLVLGFLSLATVAEADPRDEAMAAMMRCTGIADPTSRLNCYDGAVGRVRGAMVAPPPAIMSAPAPYQPEPVPQHSFTSGIAASASVPPPATPPRPPRKNSVDRFVDSIFESGPARPPQTSVQQFGIESVASHGDKAYPLHRDGDTVDSIGARVVAYRFLANARLIVTLDNGQDWIETSGDNLVGHLAHPALYYSARIDRSSNGSYDMNLTGLSRSIPVRRLR